MTIVLTPSKYPFSFKSTSGPKRTKITAKMLLEAQSSRLSNGEPLSSINGVAMGWYVAVIRNLTRFDEPEQVPIEIGERVDGRGRRGNLL